VEEAVSEAMSKNLSKNNHNLKHSNNLKRSNNLISMRIEDEEEEEDMVVEVEVEEAKVNLPIENKSLIKIATSPKDFSTRVEEIEEIEEIEEESAENRVAEAVVEGEVKVSFLINMDSRASKIETIIEAIIEVAEMEVDEDEVDNNLMDSSAIKEISVSTTTEISEETKANSMELEDEVELVAEEVVEEGVVVVVVEVAEEAKKILEMASNNNLIMYFMILRLST